MAQHDLVIDNASGATVRADINNALTALGSTMKGTGAPSAPLAGMQWVEDDNPSGTVWTWKIYDGTGWISAGQIDTTNDRFIPTGLFSGGTTALPGFAPAGDPDTGISSTSGNTLSLSTAGTEALQIDSTQNVYIPTQGKLGLGTTSPAQRVHVSSSTAVDTYVRTSHSGATAGLDVGTGSDGNTFVYNRNNTSLSFGTNNLTRATLTNAGYMRFGQTSTNTPGAAPDNTQGACVGLDGTAHFSNTAGAGYIISANRAGNGWCIAFNRDGASVGSISVSAGATAYNTSSDYRLKSELEAITGAVAAVVATPVYRFRWNATPQAPKVMGFLAHEAQATVPEAVDGEKDGPRMQGIDQSKMVPLLWAAVQELAARVAAAEAQLANP